MSDNNDTPKLKACPFCGEMPELPSGDGTQYDIECNCGQASSSIQISDYMTIEERAADKWVDYRYDEEFVDRAKLEAIKNWNIRTQEWISVEKQFPLAEQGNKVLGFNGDYIFECEFDEGFWCNIGGETMTHWQPLPDSPLNNGEG